MRVFYTPPKSWMTTVFLVIIILASPIVLAAHFAIRAIRGDYGTADKIMVPIAEYLILAFPFVLIFLVGGLRRYASGRFLFAWNTRRFWRSLLWTALLLTPVDWTRFMILDGIDGRIYWVTAFFVLHFYCLLVLRACLVSYEADLCSAKVS
jgi:hypothetical protein